MTNLDTFKQDLEQLIIEGHDMTLGLKSRMRNSDTLRDAKAKDNTSSEALQERFRDNYEHWYTLGRIVIKQIIPDRLTDFEGHYKSSSKKIETNGENFTIYDWQRGIRAPQSFSLGLTETGKTFDDELIVLQRLVNQVQILESAKARFTSSLFDIRQVLQADMFDSELNAAKELLDKGFIRAAGVIIGVVLEKHLSEVCDNHGLDIKKKRPTLFDYYESLKTNDVIDANTWKKIEYLSSVRNTCSHDKKNEPKAEEVAEL